MLCVKFEKNAENVTVHFFSWKLTKLLKNSQVLIPMKSIKLQRHLKTNHSDCSDKPLKYFMRKKDSLAYQKSCILKATKVNENALRASFLVAIHIAKAKNHTQLPTI